MEGGGIQHFQIKLKFWHYFRASPTPHHTLNEERSARFTAQPLSALLSPVHTKTLIKTMEI